MIHLSQRVEASPEGNHSVSRRKSRQAANVSPTAERQEAEPPTLEATTGSTSQGPSEVTPVPPGTDGVNHTRHAWTDPSESTLRDADEEFVNGVVPEYEDSNEPGSAMDLPSQNPVLPTRLPPVLLELRWLPPRPPSSYDGFNVYVYRDGRRRRGLDPAHFLSSSLFSSAGNLTESASVDENTHEFFTELREAGTYRVQVASLSSSGQCEARESVRTPGSAFYLGASTAAAGHLVSVLLLHVPPVPRSPR